MARVRSVAGGGRGVEVEPERLAGWFERFAASHGGAVSTSWAPPTFTVTAADGTKAELVPPFGGLPDAPAEWAGLAVGPLLEHVCRGRRIGLLLVRLGGYSVGVAAGATVITSSTGARLVHGRNRAGGSSAGRFARRREGQARVALQAAADAAARVLLPEADRLDAVVLGGDSAALAALRSDPRLAALLARAEPRVLDVPEPRRVVLDEAALRARRVEIVIRLAEAAGGQ